MNLGYVKLILNYKLLQKVTVDPDFEIGDKVRIRSDVRRLKKNQKHHAQWNSMIGKLAGYTGTITEYFPGQVGVRVHGASRQIKLNVRSLLPFEESFAVGDHVTCVLPSEILIREHREHTNLVITNFIHRSLLHVTAQACFWFRKE